MMDEALTTKSEYKSVGEVIPVFGGFGRFQQILTTCFSIMILPGTYATLIMYFAALYPSWKCTTNSTVCLKNETFPSDNKDRCDMNRSDWYFAKPRSFSIVTNFDVACDDDWVVQLSSSILFIGWGIGAVILGWVSDNYGRKLVIFPSYFVVMFVGFIAAFSPSLTFLIICRFIVGFFTPGTGVQSVVLLSEYVNTKYRPHAITIVWSFFTLALCLLPLKAYFIMNWKILFIACTAPYFFILGFYKFIPESARWIHLHDSGVDRIMDIFHRIAYWNKKELPTDFTLLPLQRRSEEQRKTSPLDLFRTRKSFVSTIVQGYVWLVNGMVYYGLSLAADDLGGSLYLNFALLSLIEFPANLIAMFMCDKIGRRKTTFIVMALGGIACVVVAFVPATGSIKVLRVILGMFGKLCITISFSAVYVWSLEIFSTDIRAEGMGFLQITSRVGAASSPWIAKSLKALHIYAPFIVMGSLSILASIVCLILPETMGKPTKDVSTDGDEEQNSTNGTLLKDVAA